MFYGPARLSLSPYAATSSDMHACFIRSRELVHAGVRSGVAVDGGTY